MEGGEREGQTFIGALAQLSIMRCLLDEIEDGLGEGLVCYGPCCWGWKWRLVICVASRGF